MVGTPRSKHKKRKARGPKNKTAIPPLDQLETGMPALDSIIGVDEFKKGRKTLRIIHTNEVDEYERAPSKTRRKKRVGRSESMK